MTTIAFLGLGAMGIRMAKHLIDAGHDIAVWNRTASTAAPLIDAGARRAETPREAAKGADIAIAVVRDNDASEHVWLNPETGALAGMDKGALAIECSTVTPDHIAMLSTTMETAGVSLVDAPIAGSRPQAEAGQLVFLISGTDDAMARATPVLETIGSKAVPVGPSGHAAALKLANNALLGIQVAAMAELLPMMRKSGLDLERCIAILEASPILSGFAAMASRGMIAGNVPPMFPIDLLRKDGGYVTEIASKAGQSLPMTTRMNQTLDEAISGGLGDENFTSLIKHFQQQ